MELLELNELKILIKTIYKTQKRFAEAIGLDPWTLNTKLNGHVAFTLPEAVAIVKGLDLGAEDTYRIFFKN